MEDYLRHANGIASPTGVDPARYTGGVMVRAYILRAYAADDTTESTSPVGSGSPDDIGSVLCDVMVIEPGFRGMLNGVPVLTAAGGLDDVEYWQPTPMTAALTGLPVDMSDLGPLAQDPNQTNADLVIVGFLGNDASRPIILGKMLKPTSNHKITTANLNAYRWVQYVNDVVIGVEAGGRVVIDTTAQPLAVPPKDDEVVIKTGGTGGVDGVTITVSGGNVTIETGATGKLTVTGNALTTNPAQEEVMLASALSDIATVLLEQLPVVTAVASLFGIPLTQSPVVIPGLAAGYSTTTGFPYTSKSLETD